MKLTIYNEDVRTALQKIPASSIDTIITSPPYYHARNYGKDTETIWGGNLECKHEFVLSSYKDPMDRGGSGDHDHKKGEGMSRTWQMENYNAGYCKSCNAWFGQLGTEPTPDLFISHLLEITKELKRILKESGSILINIGDTYANKSTQLVPQRLAIGMMNQGFYIRNYAIWYKSNAQPSPVPDRFVNGYEPIIFATKSPKYYFSQESIREKISYLSQNIKDIYEEIVREAKARRNQKPLIYGGKGATEEAKQTQSSGLHEYLATLRAVGKKILAEHLELSAENKDFILHLLGYGNIGQMRNPLDIIKIKTEPSSHKHYAQYPTALIEYLLKATCPPSGTVLDPFMGSGTTALAAMKLGLNCIGVEISKRYCDIMEKRTNAVFRSKLGQIEYEIIKPVSVAKAEPIPSISDTHIIESENAQDI